MKILLINPGRDRVTKQLDTRASAPPLGLLYVASSLEKNNHEIKLIDQGGSFISDEELIKTASSFNPDLVCFSVMGAQSISAARITDKLKEILPNARFVFGGINPTFSSERIMGKYNKVDFCLQGEGEESILELCKAIKTNGFKNVHGLVYRADNKIHLGKPRRLIENLDSLSFPDRNLVKDIEYGSVSGLKMKKFTSIISSRGCPHRCTYCICNALVNSKWRARGVKNVVDELEIIQNQGYKNFIFFDDCLTLNEKRTVELAREIRNRKIDMDWLFEGRVDMAKKDVLREMVKAGAKVAYFGAESANQRILDCYNKTINPEQTKLAVRNARKAGMDFIIASFILGCPTETKEEVENTIKFMCNLDVDFVQVTNLYAYPGTFLWDEMVKKGQVDADKYWETGIDVGSVHPESLPSSYLTGKVEEAYKRVLGNRVFKIRHALRLAKSRFRQKVFFSNVGYFTKNLANNLLVKS